MSNFACFILLIGLDALLQSKPVAAMAFEPKPTVYRPSRLGIQAAFEPTARCQEKKNVLEFRQDSSDASPATCGWVGGNPSNPVKCGSSLYCATTSTFIGCCESSSCVGIFTTCYDLLGAACDLACQNNPQNLVCPTALPYCALYNYAHGSVGYGCAQYSGYTSTVLLSPVTTAIGTLTGIGSSTFQNTSTASTTSSTTATPSPSSSSSSLSPGAVAGIAITGVAVVVAICYLIFRRRSRRRKNFPVTRQSYIGSTTSSTTVHPSGDCSGTKFVFPSPQSPPWEWSAAGQPSPGLLEMPAESGNTPHELHAVSR